MPGWTRCLGSKAATTAHDVPAAADAHVIDTGRLTVDQVVSAVLRLVEEAA